MTADERIEALLNRAGQTISDLPRKGTEASEPYPLSACPKANGAAWGWYLDIGGDMDDYDSTRTKLVLKQYILHLTDVIDRMETALENVIGERDYLMAVVDSGGLFDCKMCALEEGSEDCCTDADFNETGKQPIFRVPEDWRADDD